LENRKTPQFKIARFHNVYEEGGVWYGGREKAPAALLRKAICSNKYTQDNTIEIWGNGKQKRSFLYIEDCVDAVVEFMESNLDLSVGSEESISIEELAYVAFETIGMSQDIQDRKYQIKIYIGIDKDDALFHPIKDNPAEKILYKHGFTDIDTIEFDFPPGSICGIWRELACKAYEDNCDYFVLFGDDVIIKTDGWIAKHQFKIKFHVVLDV